MTLLPELDELDPDMLVLGDTPTFATVHGALYTPEGVLLAGNGADIPADEYTAAWRKVQAWREDPENWRGNLFNRDEDFLVTTHYVGLDMTTMSLGLHVPEIWETQILTQSELLGLWRYYSRAAAFAGHEKILAILDDAPGVTRIK